MAGYVLPPVTGISSYDSALEKGQRSRVRKGGDAFIVVTETSGREMILSRSAIKIAKRLTVGPEYNEGARTYLEPFSSDYGCGWAVRESYEEIKAMLCPTEAT